MRFWTLIVATIAVSFAQRLDRVMQPGSAGEMVVREFEKSAPAVGAQFPDFAIYDADGKPFRTASFRGRYTVLVTGCLT